MIVRCTQWLRSFSILLDWPLRGHLALGICCSSTRPVSVSSLIWRHFSAVFFLTLRVASAFQHRLRAENLEAAAKGVQSKQEADPFSRCADNTVVFLLCPGSTGCVLVTVYIVNHCSELRPCSDRKDSVCC
jgi:hypothetical protein